MVFIIYFVMLRRLQMMLTADKIQQRVPTPARSPCLLTLFTVDSDATPPLCRAARCFTHAHLIAPAARYSAKRLMLRDARLVPPPPCL